MSHWAAKYIGIPYCLGGREPGGLDCYGLVKLIYQAERGIHLPDLPGVTENTVLAICREIVAQSQGLWREVLKPVDGCVVAMSQREALHHVGVWAATDGGKVVHAYQYANHVVAETLLFLHWKGFKTIRFFVYGVHH
jgi:cell wall-associated NlpC family hydrolase